VTLRNFIVGWGCCWLMMKKWWMMHVVMMVLIFVGDFFGFVISYGFKITE
jgi:hypothetical protein